MKLVFLCNNMKSTNGVERALSQRLSLLAESGLYEVYLITYNQYGEPFSFPISGKVHYEDLATRYINRCSYHGLFQYLDRFFSKIRYKRAVCNCINRIKPDVITCVDIYLADMVTVLSLHVDAVKVVECHCGLSAYFMSANKWNSTFRRNSEYKMKNKLVRTIKKFDKIVVMTDAEKQDWNMDDKVIHIPNMLVNYPDEITNITRINHRVISVGRYAYQKGYDLLLNAWERVQTKYPNWSLHIYGSHDGDMGDYKKLVEIREKKQLNHIYLHSATNDVYSKYIESDFYVMSSRFESFGLVLIEAMACALPVISFDCKYGPRSIVKTGQTGVLVPENDVEKLAEVICSMIENDDMCRKMGANARIESKKYLPEIIMPFWHDFYKSLGRVRPIVS